MLRASNLILIWLALLGVIVIIGKLSGLDETIIITFVSRWLWIYTRLPKPYLSLRSWLHVMPPTPKRSVSVIRVIWMGVIAIAPTGRASIHCALCVWIPALTPDTGVLDVIAPPSPLASCALDLLIRKSRVMSRSLRLPMFATHKTNYAPGHSASKCPRPDASSIGLLAT